MLSQFGQASVDVGMGNKQDRTAAGEEGGEGARLPPTGRPAPAPARPATTDGTEEDPDTVEVPPPMRPISSLPGPDSGGGGVAGEWAGQQQDEEEEEQEPATPGESQEEITTKAITQR